MNWIRVEERMPGDGEHVLVAGKGWQGTDFVVAAYYSEEKEGWWEANTHWVDASDGQVRPTHWMPLPPPPSPDSHQEQK